MSSLLISNAHLVTLDDANRCIENGSVYIEDGRIAAVGDIPAGARPDRQIDAGGNVVMPGFINTHHHLYSTFARGFTPPGAPPTNFEEILRKLWWKLDKALDADDVYYSAVLALMDAARHGCTTVIDHHASPSCWEGSLDRVEQAFRDVGLSGCLCYEVSDRNAEGEGIEENLRYIRRCREAGDGQMTALFGMHAQMTLGDRTLDRCAEAGLSVDAGFHVHIAEDLCDVRVARETYGKPVMDRFVDAGVAGPKSIFVHGVHLGPEAMEQLRATDSMLVNCPESNMNNAVGTAPVLEMLKHGVTVGLGTDGMSSHMISQARAMYLQQRAQHVDPTIGFVEAAESLLLTNRDIANRIFADARGALEPGQLADIVIFDYLPFTPLTADTLYGHLLFGLAFAPVRTTIARGEPVVVDGRLPHLDEAAIRARCAERAPAIWQRAAS